MVAFINRKEIKGGHVNKVTLSENPVLDRVYKSRGISSHEELKYDSSHLLSYKSLKNIELASNIVTSSIINNERIVVLADYDADGATGGSIIKEGLRLLGYNDVHVLVPNRFTQGYGLTPEVAEDILALGPDLVITVDNGISSVEGAKTIKDMPMAPKLVITDHHLPPEKLPIADAIVNPNQKGCGFPSKALAGCGVAFYLILATRDTMLTQGLLDSSNPPNLASLLDLVALGTVADVVPLDYNNRTLVNLGLRWINAGKARPGINALLEVSKREIGDIVASDFGFGIGPRLNAAGRLKDMTVGIQCLTSRAPHVALELAEQLDSLNKERKEIESKMKSDAMLTLNQFFSKQKAPDTYGVCLFNKSWHQGVIGILASRIKDEWFRPTICFAQDDDPKVIKGSARSVQGFHMRDVLSEIDAEHPGMILKYGGHAAAAGLSLLAKDFNKFYSAFNEKAKKYLSKEQIQGIIETDGTLSDSELNINTAYALRKSGPWGQGFPEPIFHGKFFVVNQRVLTGKHLKLRLQTESGNTVYEGIIFNYLNEGDVCPDLEWVIGSYKLDVNKWNNRENLQLLFDRLYPLDSSESESLPFK